LAAKKDGGFLNEYFEHSRRPIYSIVASAPFFVAYQLGVTFLLPKQAPEDQVRNGAEMVLHELALLLGNKHVGYVLPVLLGMVLLYVLHRRDLAERAKAGAGGGKKQKRPLWGGFRFDFWFTMYLEGMILALPLGLLQQQIPQLLSVGDGDGGTFFFRLTTMCGAGAWEELLFRLFLFTGLYYLGHKLLTLEKLPAGILAAVVSGVIFSAFHFLGVAEGRGFTFFVFATLAGVYLAGICHLRSFGLAVCAHAIYDIFIVLTGG
jgi:hypothetical protein